MASAAAQSGTEQGYEAMPASPNIAIYSDVICPWCFVGKRQLDAAMASLPLVFAAELGFAVAFGVLLDSCYAREKAWIDAEEYQAIERGLRAASSAPQVPGHPPRPRRHRRGAGTTRGRPRPSPAWWSVRATCEG